MSIDTSIRDTFGKLRDEAVALLERAAVVMDEVVPLVGKESAGSHADAFRERAESVREKEFVVVVAGEMKRGKSTLLNAMMGQQLLTTDVLECTATVNFLRHPQAAARDSADEDEVIVKFTDGKQEAVRSADLKDYTSRLSSMGREEVANQVDHVEVFVDSPFLKDGVVLVDTPGTNTTTANHMRITNEQIDRSSAAIFLASGTTQVTRSDQEFLDRLGESVVRIFVLVNRIDEVTESDVPRVLEAARGRVEESVGESGKVLDVIGVSGIKALLARTGYAPSNIVAQREQHRLDDPEFRRALLEESNLSAFESALEQYLFGGEKSADLLRGPFTFVLHEVDRRRSQLEKQIDVLDDRFDLTSHEQKIHDVERQINERKRNLEGESGELAGEISTALAAAQDAFEEKHKGAEESLLDQLREYDSPEALKANWSEGDHVRDLPGRALVSLGRQAHRLLQNAVNRALSKQTLDLKRTLREQLGDLKFELPTPSVNLVDTKVVDTTAAQEMQKIEQQLHDYEQQMKQFDSTYTGTKRREYEDLKERHQREIEDYQKRMSQLGSRPEARIREVVKERKGDVRGLVGAVSFVLRGAPREHYTEEVKDDTNVRHYDSQLKGIEEQYQKKRAEWEKRIEKARVLFGKEEANRLGAQRLEELKRNHEAIRDRVQKRLKEDGERSRQETVRGNHTRLLNSFRRGVDEIKNSMEEITGRTEEIAADYIAGIKEELDQSLNSEQAELDRLKSLKEQDESKKKAAEQRIRKGLQELQALQEAASSLMDEHEALSGRIPT